MLRTSQKAPILPRRGFGRGGMKWQKATVHLRKIMQQRGEK
jgi:hypothetical protein